jgi:hypothetical protein
MSKPPIRLTEDQIREIAIRIAKPCYKYIQKTIVREFNKIPNAKQIHISDYINVVMVALSTVDKNMLAHMKRFFKSATNQEIDFIKLITNISTILILLWMMKKRKNI